MSFQFSFPFPIQVPGALLFPPNPAGSAVSSPVVQSSQNTASKWIMAHFSTLSDWFSFILNDKEY